MAEHNADGNFQYILETSKKLVEIETTFKEKITAAEKALAMQAKEYERRLADLNHEADQLKSMQGTYVQKSIYEIQRTALEEKLEGKINQNSRLLYIGIGIVMALEFVLRVFVK